MQIDADAALRGMQFQVFLRDLFAMLDMKRRLAYSLEREHIDGSGGRPPFEHSRAEWIASGGLMEQPFRRTAAPSHRNCDQSARLVRKYMTTSSPMIEEDEQDDCSPRVLDHKRGGCREHDCKRVEDRSTDTER